MPILLLYGTGRLVNIDHSWITLDGFTVDGQEQLASVPFPTDVRTIDAWKASIQDRVVDGRLVYIGSAEESLPIKYEGEDLTIGFNADYLRDGIQSFDDDTVTVQLISPLRPGLMSGEDGDLMYLIMPVRLPE